MPQDREPIVSFAVGRISCDIFEREGDSQYFYDSRFYREYEADDGETRKAWTFGERDLSDLATATSDAYNWIAANRKSKDSSEPAEEAA